MEKKTPEQAAMYAFKMDFDVEQESGYWAGLEFAFGKKFAVKTYSRFLAIINDETEAETAEREKIMFENNYFIGD